MLHQRHLPAHLALSLPLVAAVASCAAPHDPKVARASAWATRVQHGQWQVAAVDGRVPVSVQTLRLGSDGILRGQAGCNEFAGTYSIDADRFTPGRLETNAPVDRAATAASPSRVPCTAAQQADERRFLGVLERVNAFVLRDDETLLLLTPGEQLIEARRR